MGMGGFFLDVWDDDWIWIGGNGRVVGDKVSVDGGIIARGCGSGVFVYWRYVEW